jgi:sugar phosphate isomerase/epimerase
MEIPVLITGARPEQSGPEVEEHFRRNAVVLADLAAKLGVVLCLENLGFLLGTGEECAAFMQQLGRPNLRVNYDPAALMLLRGVKTTKDDIAAVAPYLAHFHFNDKASMKIGKMDLRPIGEGIVDWEPIISALDSAGYTGPASIEFVLEDEPESPEVVDDAVRRSVQFLQKYMSN